MVKAKDEEKAIARDLRQKGLSYGEIAKELGVAKSSVKNWCGDIQLNEEQEAAINHRKQQWGEKNEGAKVNKEKALHQRRLYQEVGRQIAREKRRLHVIGCMLYWAEGGKTRRNEIIFANSDPQMLLIFIKFLREELSIPDEIMKIEIHCYAKTDEERVNIETYWLDLLKLPATCLYPSQILEGTENRHNRLEHGVCSIRVHSTEHAQHIYGAIQEYGGFENEEWLY